MSTTLVFPAIPAVSRRLKSDTVKAVAARERARLKRGYEPDSAFVRLLDQLEDQEIVEHYMTHVPMVHRSR